MTPQIVDIAWRNYFGTSHTFAPVADAGDDDRAHAGRSIGTVSTDEPDDKQIRVKSVVTNLSDRARVLRVMPFAQTKQVKLKLADGSYMTVDDAWESPQGVWYRQGGLSHLFRKKK